MSVILAIENDRRQIAQLTTIVRELGAELVLGKSADDALAALGQRVPDLILTPPLLSPKDDSALTTRLRELGTAAVHVQMLSIPILASVGAPSRSKLSILRKGKEESVGCAPDVFKDQLVEYLERAARDKRRAEAEVRFAQESAAAAAAADAQVGEEMASADYAQLDDALEEMSQSVALTTVAGETDEWQTDETVRMATERRVAEEQRAVKAANEAHAAEQRRAAAEAAIADAIDRQSAAERAAQAAADARAAEEQRAAQAAREAQAAEERRAAADAAIAAVEKRAAELQ